MKHYIVTNRPIITKDGVEHISNNGYLFPSTVLRFATYDTAKPKKDRVTVIPDVEVNDAGLVNYATETEGSSLFFKDLYTKMKTSKGSKDLLVFVHGFGNDNDDVETHLDKLHKHYVSKKAGDSRNIDTILIFSWTTNGKILSLKDYSRDSYDSNIAGVALSRLYQKIIDFFEQFFGVDKKEPCGKNIHLMCHSMGAQVLQHMVEALLKNNQNTSSLAGREPLQELFKEIILVAPDAPEDLFEKGKAYSYLTELGERVHVYTHRRDKALWISERKNRDERLGRAKIKDLPVLDDVYYIETKKINRGKGGWQGVKDEAIQHWYYYNSKRVIADINLVFSGKPSKYISPSRYKREDKVLPLA